MDTRPMPSRDPVFCYWDYYEPVARHSKEMRYCFSVRATHYNAAIDKIDEALREGGRTRAIGYDIRRIDHIPTE